MSTERRRGPRTDDYAQLAPGKAPRLAEAARDLAWLLSRGYSPRAARTFVGDHFQLPDRQRLALTRGVVPPELASQRRARRVTPAGRRVVVDGFNVLVTMEAALGGAVLIRGQDGLLRDLTGVHGTYHPVQETDLALRLLVDAVGTAEASVWYFDRRVSNSGRLAAALREAGQSAEVVDSADAAALATGWAIATADGPVLDMATHGVDLVGSIVASLPERWIVDLGFG